mgnify:FL=1
MKQEIIQLRNLIDAAKALSSSLTISIRNNMPIDTDTLHLLEIVKQIIPLIKDEFGGIANVLLGAIGNIKIYQIVQVSPNGQPINKESINLYYLRDMMTAVNILDSLYTTENQKHKEGKKIFISHASADESIVKAFTKEILLLGCGFSSQDIFCTLDHTAIRTGDDFRNRIVESMKGCDFVFCLISENYRQSEVCQNEMGAAWALDGKRVLPFKFPNIKFTELGFLNVVKQAADITDNSKLDELYIELCEYYDLQQDWINFNQRKADFINVVNESVN